MTGIKKYISKEIIDTLPNWLIHFLWYLFEECARDDAQFDGRFALRCTPDGQRIICRVNGHPYAVDMPCPDTADAEVEIVREGQRLVMCIP